MTAGKTTFYGVGAGVLFSYLALANMPSPGPAGEERGPRHAAAPAAESLAGDVRAQATRLQARMAQAPAPDQNARNPFSFAPAPRAARTMPWEPVARAASTPEGPPAVSTPPDPPMSLMGIAEETRPAGIRRTAVIALAPGPGGADTIYMVVEGQPVGNRYKVTKIGVDAVELEDLLTKGYRRLALR